MSDLWAHHPSQLFDRCLHIGSFRVHPCVECGAMVPWHDLDKHAAFHLNFPRLMQVDCDGCVDDSDCPTCEGSGKTWVCARCEGTSEDPDGWWSEHYGEQCRHCGIPDGPLFNKTYRPKKESP